MQHCVYCVVAVCTYSSFLIPAQHSAGNSAASMLTTSLLEGQKRFFFLRLCSSSALYRDPSSTQCACQALLLCNICVVFQSTFDIKKFAFYPRLDKCHRRSQIFPIAFCRLLTVPEFRYHLAHSFLS